jgi:hypothetical protein
VNAIAAVGDTAHIQLRLTRSVRLNRQTGQEASVVIEAGDLQVADFFESIASMLIGTA